MVWRTGRLTWGSSGALDAAGAEDGGVFRSRRNMQELCKTKQNKKNILLPCTGSFLLCLVVAELEAEHAGEFE